MKHLLSILLLAAGLSGCGQQTTVQKLTLSGSSTVAPLVAELARAYEQAHPGIEVDVQSGGSSRGVSDTRHGLANIGMVSRVLKENEHDLSPYTIAHDGITLIVHQDNPIAELSAEQVVSIYTGKINNWATLGGVDQPMVVVNKAEGHSTLELFLKHFKLANHDIKADLVIGNNQQGLKTVANNPWAIGYVSIGSAEYEAANGQPIKLLPLEGVPASTASVKAGNFPLSRPLNLVTAEPASGATLAFIKYAQSTAAHAIIEQHFFIPTGD